MKLIRKILSRMNPGLALFILPASVILAAILDIAGPVHAQQVGQINCSQSAIYDASSTGPTQLITNTGLSQIYVCGFIITTGAGAANVKLESGTGAACATGNAALTPAFQLPANGRVEDNSSMWRGLRVAPARNVCINSSAAVAVQGVIYFTQQ